MKMPDKVLYEKHGAVALLQLNTPETGNAMDLDLGRDLTRALEAAAADDEVRTLVLAGRGKHFSAGANVKAIKAMIEADPNLTSGRVLRMFVQAFSESGRLMLEMDKPIIAAVSGAAAGGGLALALACDMVLAAENATFDPAYVRLGLVPMGGLSSLLPAMIGPKRAAEFLFWARPVKAPEALGLGIINQVHPPDQVLEKAMNLAAELASRPGLGLLRTKRLLGRNARLHLAEQMAEENECLAECGETPEHQAMMEALLKSL